jgi:hypothetical protein
MFQMALTRKVALRIAPRVRDSRNQVHVLWAERRQLGGGLVMLMKLQISADVLTSNWN